MSTEMPENLLWDPGDARLSTEFTAADLWLGILATPLLDLLVTSPREAVPTPALVHPLHAIVSFADDDLPAIRSEMRRLLTTRLQAVGDELMAQWEARQENRDVAES